VLKKQLLEHKMSPENTRKSETKIAIVTGGRPRPSAANTVLSLAKRGVNSIFTYNSNQAEAEKVTGLAAGSRAKGDRPAAGYRQPCRLRFLCAERARSTRGIRQRALRLSRQ